MPPALTQSKRANANQNRNHAGKLGAMLAARRNARRLHRLGERPCYELIGELVASSSNPKALLARVRAFAEIDGDTLRAYGGDRLVPTPWAVK
jgi:hypothetical protein